MRGKMRLIIILMLMNSAYGSTPYLIEKLGNGRTHSFSRVIETLKTISSKSGHLISLGESHLHPNSARAVSQIFIDTYLEDQQDFKFCAEKIDDFLNHPTGLRLQQEASKVDIYTENSPTQTDFRKCKTKDFDKYFTYSGFFHQLPFARPFPLELSLIPI